MASLELDGLPPVEASGQEELNVCCWTISSASDKLSNQDPTIVQTRSVGKLGETRYSST